MHVADWMADPLDQLRIDRTTADQESPWPRRALLLAIAVVLVGGATWYFSRARAVVVETTVVKEAPGGAQPTTVLEASGYVVARRQATVASKITGRLVEVAIEEGMTVTDGQVLARLDDANARHALGLAEARQVAAETALKEIQVRLHEAELDLGRIRQLVASGVDSRASLDRAVAQRGSAVARVAVARADVEVGQRAVAVGRQDSEGTPIRAPFDGVVVSKDAQPGEIVSPVSAGGGFTRTGVGTIVDM